MKNKSNFIGIFVVLLVVLLVIVLALLFGGAFLVYQQINKMFGRLKRQFFFVTLSLIILLAAFIVLIQRLTA